MNKKVNTVDFGKRLCEIRNQKGFTQNQLSEISGVSRRIISHYERMAKRPSLENIDKIANALNVTIEMLLGATTKSTKKRKKEEEVSCKIMKKVRIIEKLPTRDQNAIFHYINALAEKNKLKGKIKEG